MAAKLKDLFVHLRVRSAYSLLEGAIKADALGALAAEQEMPAVALTDRCNLFGALEFSVQTKERGIQPIIGCALPVSGLPAPSGRLAVRAPLVVLLAQNEAGWRRLCELSSTAYLDNDGVSEPAVPWNEVCTRTEGLILLSGGYDGPANRLFAAGRGDEAVSILESMVAAFPGRFYVELQRHGRPEETLSEAGLVAFAYARNVPLVATNDVFFADRKTYAAHDALLCIQQGAFLGQDDRPRVTPEHCFKSAREMRELFSDLPEACDRTIEIARRCAFMVNKRDPILPGFETGAGRSEADELAAQAREGLKARLATRPPVVPLEEYEARLEREIGVIQQMGFSGYFLIVSDFIKWAKSEGIPVGPGRGSGAGSLVAYSLTITDLDPLRFGLLFERFLNPERVSMPDFDIDFCQDRREEVISYVQNKYGNDRVAQIITFGTLQARAVLRDVGRVMQMPLGQVDRLAKMVPNNPANPVTLAKAIEIEPRLQQARRDEEIVASCLEIALQLEGLYRNASTHAAGVVIGDRKLTELVPLYRDPRSDIPATQFNMKWVESAGLVKFDFLGLKTLTVIDRAVRHMAKRGAVLDLDTLPLDEARAYELMSSGQTVGVFQLESQGMRDTLRKLRPETIEEVTALISLYRPGPMDNIDSFVDCKFGRKPVDTLHDSLEPVLRETFGIIVYQEQVMQIAQILAGYSLGEADLLRRAMGKKKKEEMDQQKARFVAGAREKGVPEAQADSIFELVAKFAGYGFNKSHAAAYAVIAYQTAWLKAMAPVEFMAASMSLDISNTDKLAVFYQDSRRFGIAVRPPDVNRSGADFEVEDGEVLYALGAIRNVGHAAMTHLVEVREQGGAFRDIFDLVERVDPRLVNKRALENLARSGALDSLGMQRAQILANLDLLLAHSQTTAADRNSEQVSLFGGDVEIVRPRLSPSEVWSPSRQLDEELAAVGFYLTGHPLQEMVEVLRKGRTTLFVDAVSLAESGHEAFRMAGIVRRKQERAQASGDRFAFVSLSDPTGEYEVLFPPEVLRKVRDLLEPGKGIALKVRAKARDGEVRFFADDAEPIESVLAAAGGGLRIHFSSSPDTASAIQKRLELARTSKGGEVTLVLGLEGGRQVDVKLPGRFQLDAAVRGALKISPGVLYLEEA